MNYYTDGSMVFTTSLGVGVTHSNKEISMPMVQVYKVEVLLEKSVLLSVRPFYLDTHQFMNL